MASRNYYTTSNYTNYSIYGGRIYDYDYDDYTSMSDIASRIATDMKFDDQCKKNIENRNRKTLERK
mgnify:FL=1